MIRLVAICAFASVALWSWLTLACGGGFGEELTMEPSQTVIVRHGDNEETYIFRPSFCGKSADFGLILPVPNLLTTEPELVDDAVFAAFESLTAPKIVTEEICIDKNSDSAGAGRGMDAGASSNDNGVDVISGGRVDIFDWVLLHADDAAAFTEWLDANGYPYDDDAITHFGYYVEKSWYFIAFKVTASREEPDPASEICGDFGPIEFAFTADTPIVPSRIAAVGEGRYHEFSWRIHVLAAEPVTAGNTVEYETLRFSGEITKERMRAFPDLGAIASVGDQLTSLNLSFYGGNVEEDISFKASNREKEYRQVITHTVYVECDDDGGCSVSGKPGQRSSVFLSLLVAVMILVFLSRRSAGRRGRG